MLECRIGSWLLKVLSRDIKTKTKNSGKLKAGGYITPTMDRYPMN